VELAIAFGALASELVGLTGAFASSAAKADVKKRAPRITVATTRATNLILFLLSEWV
jgi:hypothetical protein